MAKARRITQLTSNGERLGVLATSARKIGIRIGAVSLAFISSSALAAAFQTTAYVNVNLYSDNGVTYISGFGPLLGNCANSRLELRETRDYYNHVENAKRIMSIVLEAKALNKLVSAVYWDADGPGCRVEVT